MFKRVNAVYGMEEDVYNALCKHCFYRISTIYEQKTSMEGYSRDVCIVECKCKECRCLKRLYFRHPPTSLKRLYR